MIMGSPKATRIIATIRKRSRKLRRSSSKIGEKKYEESCTDLNSLPTEMIAEVVARVASSSIVDLCSCKLSCKVLDEIGKEKQVLKQVSLESLPLFPWIRSDDAKFFFKMCEESYNPEALFQLGVVQYFTDMKLEEGIKNLEKAAGQGHKAATYVLGIILLCNGEDECKKRAILLLVKLSRARRIVECRKKLHDTMSSIWMNNHLIVRSRPKFSCPMKELHEAWWRGWSEGDYYDEGCEERVVCETCRCNREISFFYSKLLRGYVVDVN